LRLEAGLIPLTGIRALLDLKHFNFFENLETVPPFDQKDNVAGLQDAAFEIHLASVVEIDAKLPLANEYDLVRVQHFPGNRIVQVRRYDFPGGVMHGAKLHRRIVIGEEMNARLVKAA